MGELKRKTEKNSSKQFAKYPTLGATLKVRLQRLEKLVLHFSTTSV